MIYSKHNLGILAFVICIIYSQFLGFNFLPYFSGLYFADSINLLFILISVLLIMINMKNGRLIIRKDVLRVIKWPFYIFVVNIVYCYFVYSQGATMVASKTFYLLTPFFLVIALSLYVKTEEDYLILMRHMCNAMCVVACIILLQALLSRYSIFFLKIQNAQYRAGRYRINYGVYLQALCAIYLFENYLREKRYSILIKFALMMLSIIFGANMRAMILYLLSSLAYIYWAKTGYKINIKKIVFATVGIIGISMIIYLKRRDIAILFSEIGITVRFDAIDYFWSQWIKHPLFGMGRFNSKNNSYLQLLDSGPLHQYYHDDVGIIGFLNSFGLFGIFCLAKLIANMVKPINRNRSSYGIVAKGHLLFMFLSFISISILDASRIPMLAILAIECINSNRHLEVNDGI